MSRGRARQGCLHQLLPANIAHELKQELVPEIVEHVEDVNLVDDELAPTGLGYPEALPWQEHD